MPLCTMPPYDIPYVPTLRPTYTHTQKPDLALQLRIRCTSSRISLHLVSFFIPTYIVCYMSY
jgi:hypothetical protein